MYEQRFYSVWQYFHIFPRCCKVLHLSLHVTSMFSTFFYFFLHLKPRFPHRVETALAFSGGGGRALAFSLGVLRALEHLGLMRLEWFCSATSGSHCDMITWFSHVWIACVDPCWNMLDHVNYITFNVCGCACCVPAVCVSFRLEGKDVFVFSLVLWHVDWYCRLDCLLPIGFIDADASFSSILLSSNLSKIWIYNKHWEAYVHFTVHHWSIYCMYIIMFPRFQTISKVLRPSFLSAFCEVCRCHQFCVRWLVGGVTWQWKQQKHEWTNVKNLGDILVSRHWCKILQALKIRHPRSTLLVHWLLHHFRVIKVSVYVFHIASGELNWEQHGASLAENPQRRQSEAASPMRRFQVQHLLGASTDPSELTLANLEKPESALGTVGAVSTMAAWHSVAACERMRGVSWSLSCDEPDDTKDICFFAFQS
jgi:hypothetical protein